jgi:curved DNA-binding protein CbpA
MAADSPGIDHYEVLQISANAELETIHRIYRILAQRFHPDNAVTGDAERFKQLTEAYHVLSDPERRAQYDVRVQQQRHDRARLLADAVRSEDDVEAERLRRLTLLEVLYARRRCEPRSPGIFDVDLEELVGQPREHLEFTLWYLAQKGFVDRADGSRLMITPEGVDYFEENLQTTRPLRRLAAGVPG